MSLTRTDQARRRGLLRGMGGALAGLALLIFGGRAQAQVSVKTIGGGPRIECGAWAGFVQGNTFTAAQFNGPVACALDVYSNLYIADFTNRAIEEISLAGDTVNSTTFLLGVVVSNLTTHKNSTNFQYFTNIAGVAVDAAASNLYILEPKTLLKFPLASLEASNLPALPFPSAQGLATALLLDFNSNIFVAFASTNGTNGSIVRYSQTNGVFSPMGSRSFPISPGSRPESPCAPTVCSPSAIRSMTRSILSPPTPVRPSRRRFWPEATAWATRREMPIRPSSRIRAAWRRRPTGRLVVCDTGNNRVRLIDAVGNTSLLYGTSSNVWPPYCCSCDPALYPGWVDGAAGSVSNDATGRRPVGVTVSPSGELFVTEQFYDLIRSVSGSGLTAVNPAAFPPVAQTLPATLITATNVTLNGTVIPGNETAGYYFQWGATTAYGNYTATNLVPTNVPVPYAVSLILTKINARRYLSLRVGGDQRPGQQRGR